MANDPRVSTATSRSQKWVPLEVLASFRTAFECPHCGREQVFHGIAIKSGTVVCANGTCGREFRISVPPYDAHFVSGLLIDNTRSGT